MSAKYDMDTIRDGVSVEWDRYFDRIYCIHYLPAKEKYDRLQRELHRIGIKDSGLLEMRYTSPSAYDAEIFAKHKHDVYAPNIGFVNICLEMRKVLYEARHFGYRQILLLEDDVAFLKDKEEVVRILEASPQGYDIVQYDKFVLDNGWMKEEWEKRQKSNRLNEYFIEASGTLFTSAACMRLSRKGIDSMLRLMDKMIIATDVAPLLMKDCRYAVAVKNLAIQVFYETCNSRKTVRMGFLHQAYQRGGVDYTKYAVPEGYCMLPE